MSEGVPSYSMGDAGISYHATRDLTLTAGVYNVLDKRIDYETYSTILDGRRYTLGATLSF